MKLQEGKTAYGFDILDLTPEEVERARKRGLKIIVDQAFPSDNAGGVLIINRSSFGDAFEKAIDGALTQKNASVRQKR